MLDEAFPNPSVLDPTTQSISASSSPPASNDETPTNEPLASRQTRWTRRKKGFKLRLNGIRPRRVISAIPVALESWAWALKEALWERKSPEDSLTLYISL